MDDEKREPVTLSFAGRADGGIDMVFMFDESGDGYVLPIAHAEYDDIQSRVKAAEGNEHIAFQTMMDWLELSLKPARGSA